MNIAELAVEPKLIKITLDDEEIVEQFGEPLEFHAWDRQPIERFLQFAGKKITEENLPQVINFCKEMILDDQGEPVLKDKLVLPATVMSRCITKVMEQLGK